MAIPMASNNGKKTDTQTLLTAMQNGTAILENGLAVPYKVKNTCAV